jgi:HK97 family phage major capsid protein
LAIAEKRYGRDEKVFERIKGLGISELTGAGALAQEQMSSDFIELLRPRVVVRTLGAMIEDMPGGQTTIPKQTGDGAAEWVGETPSQNATEPSFGQIKMVAKKLRAIIPIPNDAIRRGTNIEQRVQTTMVQQIRRAEDIAFIRGTGTAFTPKGIRNWAPAANLIPATALAGDATDHRVVNADLAKLVLAHQQADVAGERPGWMFAPRTNVFLQTLLTSDGQYAFRAEMLAGSLWGAAFGVTSQIPINLSTNKSEVYYVDFVDVKIGDTQSITVQAFDQMAYHDANGVLQSAAERDETVVIVQEETDLAVRNEESVAVLTGVGWGA